MSRIVELLIAVGLITVLVLLLKKNDSIDEQILEEQDDSAGGMFYALSQIFLWGMVTLAIIVLIGGASLVAVMGGQ